MAQGGGGDVDIFNFALTLEYLEATFYEEALKKTSGLSSDAKDLADEIEKNEAEHVQVLMSTIEKLGGKPTAAPKVDFGDEFGSEKSFLKLAQTFEDTGVSAYNGAAPRSSPRKCSVRPARSCRWRPATRPPSGCCGARTPHRWASTSRSISRPCSTPSCRS